MCSIARQIVGYAAHQGFACFVSLSLFVVQFVSAAQWPACARKQGGESSVSPGEAT